MQELTFLGHATVLVELAGVRVLTDPVLRPWTTFLRRVSEPTDPVVTLGRLRPDVVVLSHLHHDHCDLPTLRRLSAGVQVVAPVGAGRWLRRHGIANVQELVTGESATIGGLSVKAVPAVHDGSRGPLGPRAEAVGYLISDQARTLYFAGDTALFPAMSDLGEIDVALLPVWGWGPNLGAGHLNPYEAACAARMIRPRVCVPVHWGSLAPIGMARLMSHHLYDPPREFARAVRRMDLGTAVVITEPGHRVALPR
ncbi:MAG: MBL fold metallo-hydrolase [Candidatus Nanopelagicales bacterium]